MTKEEKIFMAILQTILYMIVISLIGWRFTLAMFLFTWANNLKFKEEEK